MDPAAYVEMRALEDHHWWFRGRRTVVRPLLAEALRRAPTAASPSLLEVGCGTGGNLDFLQDGFAPSRRVGLDFDASALAFCASRGLESALVQGDGTKLPVREESLDVIVALDIVEHFDDDVALLAEFHRVLRPGGQIVISVPAYPWLWSPHDDFLHHRKRYRGGELEGRLERAGFRVERRHGFNFLLFPAIALVRLLKKLAQGGKPASGTDFFELPGPLNRAVAALFSIESWLVRALPIRFGVSFMVLAAKTGAPA
jgi:SAM-dependent methyltransferase